MGIERLELVPGFLQTTDSFGRKSQIGIADALRAADIPALTYEQVQALTALANHLAVLIRTLIDRQVLDESFLEEGEYDLADIIESLEGMGGNFVEPDITVD